jgi:hyperosmotically inducible protein
LSTVLVAGKPVSDDFISDTIRQKLAADQVVKGGAIDVIVKDGAVTLQGKVSDEKQKNKAEKIAKHVNGVKSVVNQITLAQP